MINISNPANPSYAGVFRQFAYDVVIGGGFAFAANGRGGYGW